MSNPMPEVYGLISSREPSKVRYVGATVKGAAHRLNGHIHGARYGSPFPVHEWIRQEQAAGYTVTAATIEPCAEGQLRSRERYWIGVLPDLLNSNPGPRDSMAGKKSAHLRHHLRSGVVKDDCVFCSEH